MSEDETVMPHVREPVIGENREKLDFLSEQMKIPKISYSIMKQAFTVNMISE